MAKGRPKKPGAREPSGRLSRTGNTVLPPAFDQGGLAVCPDDYNDCEVTERGQIVARTVKRRGPLDAIQIGAGRHQLDGDEWNALREYETRYRACTVSVKSPLDRTPPGGNGIEGVMQWLLPAIARRHDLRRMMPPALVAHLDAVIEEAVAPDVPKLRQAARCLLLVLDRGRRAA